MSLFKSAKPKVETGAEAKVEAKVVVPKKAEKKIPKNKHFHVASKDREYFTTNLSLLLKAGVSVGEIVESMQENTSSRPLKAALKQIGRDIEEGTPLWRALDNSGIVSQQTLVLVRLGEQSGKLVDNLKVAAKQEEKQRLFRSKLRSAMLYPSFVLGMTGLVGLGVAWFLLPRLSETFDQLDVKLPLISRIFVGVGLFLKDNGFWAVPVGLAMVALMVYIIFFAPKTRLLGNWLLFHLPGISRLMYEVEIARFGYLLGTLLGAGLSVTQALQLLQESTNANRYKKFYAYLNQSFEDGYGFRASLSKYKRSRKLLPPSVQQMIIAGERSGALPETLESIGDIYQEKSDISTQNLETVLEPFMLIIVWLGVMAVAIAVILPIYSLVGGLKA